jgi:predicted transcriptional regulator
MHTVKEQVIGLVKSLPDDDLTLEDIIEELYFKVQVDKGLTELDAGQALPQSEVKARMAKWLNG